MVRVLPRRNLEQEIVRSATSPISVSYDRQASQSVLAFLALGIIINQSCEGTN